MSSRTRLLDELTSELQYVTSVGTQVRLDDDGRREVADRRYTLLAQIADVTRDRALDRATASAVPRERRPLYFAWTTRSRVTGGDYGARGLPRRSAYAGPR